MKWLFEVKDPPRSIVDRSNTTEIANITKQKSKTVYPYGVKQFLTQLIFVECFCCQKVRKATRCKPDGAEKIEHMRM